MLGNNREDELLSKLKNCIGSLKSENSNFHQAKGMKNNYNQLKENYQSSAINPTKNINTIINSKIGSLNSYQTIERQPLVVSNYQPPPSYCPTPAANYQYPPQRPQIEANNRFPFEAKPNSQKIEDYRQSSITPKKFQYSYEASKTDRQEKYSKINMDSTNKLAKNKQQEVRGQISRRYSLMQNEKVNNLYSEIVDSATKIPPSRYQQQVQQRKQLLESGINNRRERTPIAKHDYGLKAGSIRKEVNYTSRDFGKVTPEQITISSRKEKPLMIKQNLQRAYEQEKQANSNECSALTKLRKISELNEKINDRIRNIINVFEEHKC